MNMAIQIIDAPESLCLLTTESWWIDARNIEGGNGKTISGREQVVFSAMPIWRAKISPLIYDRNESRWRAFLASLRGRARAIRISPQCYNFCGVRNRLYGIDLQNTPTPHSTGALFSTGAGYAIPAPVLTTTMPIEAYGSTVNLAMNGYSAALRDGDWIGISGRARIITAIVSEPNGSMTATFEPPVSSAVLAGAQVTTKPALVMRLTEDKGGVFDRSAGYMPVQSTIELIELPELS